MVVPLWSLSGVPLRNCEYTYVGALVQGAHRLPEASKEHERGSPYPEI